MQEKELINQSKAAYGQWCKQWRKNAKHHSKYKQKPLYNFENSGVGKACLLVANGYSFEENIDIIKANADKVDILCCDKTLGHLLDNGIKPKFCMVADANVNYEKYLKKWRSQLDETILLMNVCGNTEWTDKGNWKDIYFTVNMDVMKYEREFSALSGSTNFIPAATNVSNAMVVLLTQSDNNGRNNYFGYDKLLLIGFDYSWKYGGKYYAFDEDGAGKSNYMRHHYLINAAGNMAYTSGNLMFSSRWLEKYVNTFKLPVVNCSKNSICNAGVFGDLEKNMNYSFRPDHGEVVRETLAKLNEMRVAVQQCETVIKKIGRQHYYSFLGSIS